MRCKECTHFKILYEPYSYEWGKVKCEKYNLYADYKSKQKFDRLTCEQARAVKERNRNDK